MVTGALHLVPLKVNTWPKMSVAAQNVADGHDTDLTSEVVLVRGITRGALHLSNGTAVLALAAPAATNASAAKPSERTAATNVRPCLVLILRLLCRAQDGAGDAALPDPAPGRPVRGRTPKYPQIYVNVADRQASIHRVNSGVAFRLLGTEELILKPEPAGGGVEEAGPFVLAVPAFGQVQSEVVAAAAGGARGDVDEVAAHDGAAGSGAGEAGQGPGGA
jgi:hypothetical protein